MDLAAVRIIGVSVITRCPQGESVDCSSVKCCFLHSNMSEMGNVMKTYSTESEPFLSQPYQEQKMGSSTVKKIPTFPQSRRPETTRMR